MGKILIANGANLDLLGTREPEVYGRVSLVKLEQILQKEAEKIFAYFGRNYELIFFQTNSEKEYCEFISKTWDGAVMNFGAWTHTSLAIADRLSAVELPFIELHISNLSGREIYRQRSYMAQHAVGVLYGFGIDGYTDALFALVHFLKKMKCKIV